MAPLVSAFRPSTLTERINGLPSGKTRKPGVADLRDCELKELVQYNCDLNGKVNDPRSKVVCEPVMRLFRQCANGLTAETTAWEGKYGGGRNPQSGDE